MFLNKFLVVYKFELKKIVLNKTFLISTIAMPLFLFAVIVLPAILSSSKKVDNIKIVLTGKAAQEILYLKDYFKQNGIIIEYLEEDKESLKDKVLNNKIFGYLEISDNLLENNSIKFYTKNITDYKVFSLLQAGIENYLKAKKLYMSGLNQSQISNILRPLSFETIRLSSSKVENLNEEDMFVTFFIGVGAAMLIYMSILLYGSSIGRSVVSEKSSKTVEVILSSITPLDLMFGKILGQGSAGILQYILWLTITEICINIGGKFFNLSSTILNLGKSPLLPIVFIYFVLGFFLYAALYSALGSIAEDEYNLNQISWPVMLFLIVPMVLINNFLTNPDGKLALIFSYFPMTSPIVMCLRAGLTNIKLFELIVSILLLIIFTILVIIISSKIFKNGIVMTGKKFKWKDIKQWII